MKPIPAAIAARNPQAEAAALVGNDYSVRVLEPSPPAVTEAPFFADDPTDPTRDAADKPVVAPHTAGDFYWNDILKKRKDLKEFAADRWLGARRQLPELPDNYTEARSDFHRLAYAVVASARYQSNAKFGLRYTLNGFGTPFFNNNTQVRVVGDTLVLQKGNTATTQKITTLNAAAEFLSTKIDTTAAEHDSPELGDPDRALATSPEVGNFLGEWFGLAAAALEEMRYVPIAHDPERPQLWPGHFDYAIAEGNHDDRQRATYGFSPGDHNHLEPYVYVGPWGYVSKRKEPIWNAEAFRGRILPYSELIEAPDHYQKTVDFMDETRSVLREKVR